MLNVEDVTQKFSDRNDIEFYASTKLEVTWQKALEEFTGLKHERLPFDFITDLSDDEVLIEIKTASEFRTVIGQILSYKAVKEMQLCKGIICIIVLFDVYWSESFELLNRKICRDLGIHLVIFDKVDLKYKNFEKLEKVLPESRKRKMNIRKDIQDYYMK